MLEDFFSTEVLVVGILDVGPDDTFVTEVEEIAKVVQSHHQAYRLVGMTGGGRIECAEILFDTLPVDTVG